MRIIGWTFLTLAICYLLILGHLFFFQSSHIYHPEREIVITPDRWGQAYETVWLTTDDGFVLHGWFLPVEKENAVLLLFHGNGGNVSYSSQHLKLFHKLGITVLIMDYRGYGKSMGEPSESGMYADAEAAWSYLVTQRGVDTSKLIYYGHSLGGGVASHLATHHPPAVLILEGAFTSVTDVAQSFYPFVPVRWLSRFYYDSEKNLQQFHRPLLVIHSREDEIIPFEYGRKLFDAANEPKTFLQIHGTHNDAHVISGKIYRQGLETFLRRYKMIP